MYRVSHEEYDQVCEKYYEMLDALLDLGYDLDDSITLEYDPDRNIFIDLSFGHVVNNIYDLLKPWQIYLFKHYKRDYIFPDVTDRFLVELYWPDN